MKVRLHGTPAEVSQAAARLKQVFTVLSVSRAYPDRGVSTLVRVYVEVGPLPATPQPAPAATPTTPTPPAAPKSAPAPPTAPLPPPLAAMPLEVPEGGGQ